MTTLPLYIAHGHPIGEDAEVFWMACGRTEEEARRNLAYSVRVDTEEEDGSSWADTMDDPSCWTISVQESTLDA